MPGDKHPVAGINASPRESEEKRGRKEGEKRSGGASLRDEGSGRTERRGLRNMAILSVEMRCLSDVVLRERQEERGHRGRAGISINLTAKWTV